MCAFTVTDIQAMGSQSCDDEQLTMIIALDDKNWIWLRFFFIYSNRTVWVVSYYARYEHYHIIHPLEMLDVKILFLYERKSVT